MSARPVAFSAQCAALRAPSSRPNLAARPQRAPRAALGRGRAAPAPPRAAAEREGTKEDAKLEVPDAAPGKGAAAPADQPAAEAPASSGSDAEGERLSPDDIGAQISQLRAAAKEQAKKEGMVEGVMEEVRLIKWPTPQSALLNTLLVIAIVGGTSAVLFGVNTLLAEASRVVYGAL